MRPTAPSPRVVLSDYWRLSLLWSIAAIAVVGARVHEAVPFLRLVRPALLITVLGGILVVLNTRREIIDRILRERAYRLTLAYFGWAALTVPFAIWKVEGLKSFQALVPVALVMLLILACPPLPRTLDRLQLGIVASCVATAVLSIVIGNTVDGRLSGFGSFDPNDLAGVTALSLPLALAMITRGRGIVRIAGAVGAVALVATLTQTASRGGFIALVVATVVYVLGQPGTRRAVLIAAMLVGAVITWETSPPAFRERIGTFLGGEQDYNYYAYGGRKMIWTRGVGYAINNPLLGVGVGNFGEAEGRECRKIFKGGCVWTAPHNAYLQAAAELGFPGLALFLATLVVTLKSAAAFWRPPRGRQGATTTMHRPELLAAMTGFAASAMFLSHAYFYLLFVLVAYIALARRTQEVHAPVAAWGAVPAGAPPAPVPAAPRRGGLRGRGGRRTPVPTPAAAPVAAPVAPAAPRRRGGLSLGA